MKFVNSIKKFLVSEDGPTAVEYAVMMALIIVVVIGTVTQIGNNAKAKFILVRDATHSCPVSMSALSLRSGMYRQIGMSSSNAGTTVEKFIGHNKGAISSLSDIPCFCTYCI